MCKQRGDGWIGELPLQLRHSGELPAGLGQTLRQSSPGISRPLAERRLPARLAHERAALRQLPRLLPYAVLHEQVEHLGWRVHARAERLQRETRIQRMLLVMRR